MKHPYLIGQRIIINNREIVHVIAPTPGYPEYDNMVWTKDGSGIIRWHATENCKPLPGGQL